MVTHAGKALIDPERIIQKMNLKEGMRVADMGCGRTGHFIFTISKLVGESGIVYAVDIMQEILSHLRGRTEAEGYHNIQTVWSDIEKEGATPIPPKSLDACLYINVMSMLKDRSQALKEAVRLIKDSGIIVVVDWEKKLGPLGPEKMLLPATMTDLATEAGLKFAESFSAGDYHYCLFFRK